MASSKATITKRAELTEGTSRNLLDWTPGLIRSAELQAERGDLRLAADLWDAILKDDRIQGVVGALCSVASLPISFDPPESEASKALGGRRGDWWNMLPEADQHHLIKWGHGFGLAIAYIKEWFIHPESGTMVPKLQMWRTRNVREDVSLGKFFVRLADGTETEVDDRFILYTPYGARRPVSAAPWSGLARPWLLKRYAYHDWAGSSERHGNGTEVVEEELEKQNGVLLPDNDKQAEELRKQLVADLRRLGRNAKIVLPPGFKYKLVESMARTFETFKYQIDVANSAFSIALVGQNLSTEVQSGSLAAAEVHSRVEGRVIRFVAESLSTFAHYQVLPRYCALNWGTDSPVPWPMFDSAAPEDAKEKTAAQKLFVETLKMASDAGYEIENAVELAQKLGMKLKKKNQQT